MGKKENSYRHKDLGNQEYVWTNGIIKNFCKIYTNPSKELRCFVLLMSSDYKIFAGWNKVYPIGLMLRIKKQRL